MITLLYLCSTAQMVGYPAPILSLLHVIVVGAPRDEGPGTPRAGRIYLYQLSGGGLSWDPRGTFTPDFPDALFGDEFGFSVDIHEDGIVAGTPEDLTGNPGITHGAAYFFQRRSSPSVWGMEWKFIPSTMDNGSDFGWSNAVEGNGSGTYRVVVGAPQADNHAPGVGSVFVYVGNTNQWTEEIIGPADTTNMTPTTRSQNALALAALISSLNDEYCSFS